MSQLPDHDNHTETFEYENPPLQFGAKRLYYQYSVAVPQIQLILASILQGIVFSTLLLKPIPLPSLSKDTYFLFQLPYFFQFFQHQYFYLAYILTSLVLIIVWVDYVYASAVLIWPPTTLQAGLFYMFTVAEMAMANTVSPENLPLWRCSLGLVTIIGGLIRCNHTRIFAEGDFADPFLGRTVLRNEGIYGVAFIVLGSIGVLLGLSYYVILGWIETYFPRLDADRFLHWSLYLIIFVEIIGIITVDVKYRQGLLRKLVRNTSLEVTPHGGIRQTYTPEMLKKKGEALPEPSVSSGSSQGHIQHTCDSQFQQKKTNEKVE